MDLNPVDAIIGYIRQCVLIGVVGGDINCVAVANKSELARKRRTACHELLALFVKPVNLTIKATEIELIILVYPKR